MNRYSVEFKEKVVKHYLSGQEGFSLTSKRFNVDMSTIHKWVAAYKHHGLKGLIGRPKEDYTVQFKASVIHYKQKHSLSVSAVAAKFNILSLSSIRCWERLYNIGGIEALTEQKSYFYKDMPTLPKASPGEKPDEEKTQKELIKELRYARAENAYLKKLRALIQEKESAYKKKRK